MIRPFLLPVSGIRHPWSQEGDIRASGELTLLLWFGCREVVSELQEMGFAVWVSQKPVVGTGPSLEIRRRQ